MPLLNVTISSIGNEKDFIFQFVKSILNQSVFTQNIHSLTCKIGATDTESSAITVTTESEAQTQLDSVFNPQNPSAIPTIWLIIDSNIKFRFRRGNNLDSATMWYLVYTTVGQITFQSETGWELSSDLNFVSGSSYNYTVSTERSWRYQLVFNENVLYIVFGTRDESFPLLSTVRSGSTDRTKTYQAFSYKDSNNWIGGLHCGSRLYNASGIRDYAVNRLPYFNNVENATDIETITNKVIREWFSTTKVMTMEKIWDSSFNNAVMFSVNVGNEECVYLNNYTVMPI